MSQVATVNLKERPVLCEAEKPPFCTQVVECVQAVWNAIYVWICDWAGRLASFIWSVERIDLAQRAPKAFENVLSFLQPEEVGRLATVRKSWKEALKNEQIWKVQCEKQHVDPLPKAGKYKEAFSNPEPPIGAFGVKEWREHFHEPESAPRLPPSIHRKFAALKSTYMLTLIPTKVNKQPLTLKSFFTFSMKRGIVFQMDPKELGALATEQPEKPVWVFVKKDLLELKQFKGAGVIPKDIHGSFGKALWIAVSAVAHQLLSNSNFLGGARFKYTYTSDVVAGRTVVVSGCDGNAIKIKLHDGSLESDPIVKMGVAPCILV